MIDFSIKDNLKTPDFKSVVVMFPYPSGDGLHVGHFYNYAIIDSYCRYLRFKEEKVFQPFGYDSFGLPAENYARKIGGDVRKITYDNIDKFRKQMEFMNSDFEEILITSDESYQNWTKWLFLKLKENGLAYKAHGEQDFCESCQTVLAREQVLNNCCDRCGSQTVKKTLNQWYFKITDYKKRLLDNLDKIDFPQSTINAQRKWIENQHDWLVSRQRKWGCSIPVEGEEDTLDTFVDSSFYFILYYLWKGYKPQQIDLYVGGKEHACMHLIYARFITMFLYDIGFVDFEEPFKKVIHQGMILKNGEKMSKSRGNTVDLDNYDSDEIRFYLMFLGHYFDGGEWDDSKIKGITRFNNKMKSWFSKTGTDYVNVDSLKKKVFDFTEKFKFNKVVSSFMEFLNENKNKEICRKQKEEIVQVLEIYMPNIRNKILVNQ